jgi:hypothetical protein
LIAANQSPITFSALLMALAAKDGGRRARLLHVPVGFGLRAAPISGGGWPTAPFSQRQPCQHDSLRSEPSVRARYRAAIPTVLVSFRFALALAKAALSAALLWWLTRTIDSQSAGCGALAASGGVRYSVRSHYSGLRRLLWAGAGIASLRRLAASCP